MAASHLRRGDGSMTSARSLGGKKRAGALLVTSIRGTIKNDISPVQKYREVVTTTNDDERQRTTTNDDDDDDGSDINLPPTPPQYSHQILLSSYDTSFTSSCWAFACIRMYMHITSHHITSDRNISANLKLRALNVLPACLSACLPACLPACQPARLPLSLRSPVS